MSYDVTFEYAGPQYPEDEWRNYTSNVSRMWTEAIGENLGDLIDRCETNAEMIEPLRRGVAAMEADPEKYRAMNPANGWGNSDGALGYLRWMLQMAEAVPAGTCRVWR